jgi:hypothetical protein
MPFKSEAHRIFFARRTHNSVFTPQYEDTWQATLGEDPTSVLRTFVEDGLLAPASPFDAMEAAFTVPELKAKLKGLGFKVGGKKAELVSRLIAADNAFAESVAAGKYVRTEEGKRVAEEIWQRVRQDEAWRDVDILHLLTGRRYGEAFDHFAAWNAERPSPDVLPDRAWFMSTAMDMDALPDGEREQAIHGLLVGRPHYSQGAMTTLHAAYYKRDLRQYLETPYIVGIKIEPSPAASCQQAADYAGCYRLEDAPDYPFGPCSYVEDDESACICCWYPIFDNETTGVVWKTPARRHRAVIRARGTVAGVASESASHFAIQEIAPAPQPDAEPVQNSPRRTGTEAPPSWWVRLVRWLMGG